MFPLHSSSVGRAWIPLSLSTSHLSVGVPERNTFAFSSLTPRGNPNSLQRPENRSGCLAANRVGPPVLPVMCVSCLFGPR